ncbi:MAG TPA: DUF998 domain-containing protein [Polyangia bacterium]
MKAKLLLACGVLSSLLYVFMNAFVAMQWPGYSTVSQTVSELSAIGAPTRTLWVALGVVYSLLVLLFAWGIWTSAAGHRRLRVVGALMLAYAITGLAWPFAPMHLRGTPSTLSDAMHIALAVVTSVLMVAAMGVGATALGKRFAVYSVLTIVVLLAFGTLTSLEAPGIAANRPTPWIGLWERIDIGVFLLWMVVLTVALWRRLPAAGTPEISRRGPRAWALRRGAL